MKSIFLFSLVLLMSMVSQAKIWRVNNNPGISADYTTPQAAHDAASAGDTIHLETSTIMYGSVAATKPLTWIGNGYFLDASRASILSDFQFLNGSANSLIMGIYVSNTIYVYTNNITINRCATYNLYLDPYGTNRTHDFVMTQSFIQSGVQLLYNGSSTYAASSNYTFTNNVFLGSFSLTTSFSNVTLSQNFFQNLSSPTLATVANNNIFYNCTQIMCTYATNVYNNLFMGTTNNNYVGTNGNIFVSGNPSSTNTVFLSSTNNVSDTWTTLKSGSPAIGAGLGGTDIGPSGGVNKYKFNGIPSVPSFSQFQIQNSPVNLLPVIISTKSNN